VPRVKTFTFQTATPQMVRCERKARGAIEAREVREAKERTKTSQTKDLGDAKASRESTPSGTRTTIPRSLAGDQTW